MNTKLVFALLIQPYSLNNNQKLLTILPQNILSSVFKGCHQLQKKICDVLHTKVLGDRKKQKHLKNRPPYATLPRTGKF